jgi:argininosuccinate synthase
VDRIVLAYSGSEYSSSAIGWLRDQFGAEVAAVTVDLGQHAQLDGIRQRALTLGAARAHVLDRREMYAREFVMPVIHAGVMTADRPWLPAALTRPLLAKALVEIAGIEGATAVAHGPAHEADHTRFEASIHALNPELKVIGAAWPAGAPETMSAPEVDDTSAFVNAVPDLDLGAAVVPAYVDLEFKAGMPVKVNGVAMDLVEILTSVDTIAAAHSVSGFSVLGLAHQTLQQKVMPADLASLMPEMRVTYAGLIETGQWFTPSREAIAAMMGKLQGGVKGKVRLKLMKGMAHVF